MPTSVEIQAEARAFFDLFNLRPGREDFGLQTTCNEALSDWHEDRRGAAQAYLQHMTDKAMHSKS